MLVFQSIRYKMNVIYTRLSYIKFVKKATTLSSFLLLFLVFIYLYRSYYFYNRRTENGITINHFLCNINAYAGSHYCNSLSIT